jgi:peroxiredoxin
LASLPITWRLLIFLTLIIGMVVWDLAVSDRVEASEVSRFSDFQIFDTPLPASDLTMGGLGGSIFRLSDLKGNVVLLNFWRKDCQYCVQEKIYLKKMLKQMDRPDLKVVCADLWDNPSWVRLYGQKNPGGLVFGAKLDGSRSVFENLVRGRHLGYYVLNEANEAVYEVKGFPSTYVIDKQGRVVASHMGMVEWTTLPVQKWLTGLLGWKESVDTGQETDYEPPDWLGRLLSNAGRTKKREPVEGDSRVAEIVTVR